MPDSPEKAARKPRADAVRNREHILAIAREAFANNGSGVTLDDVVRLSGLGVGTLYRHFPTREALIAALYRAEIERLTEAERELSESQPPLEALRRWMLLFVEMLATKEAMREALSGMVGGTSDLYAESGERIKAAVDTLARRAEARGEARFDIEPLDLLRALAGVVHSGTGPQWAESARRLVDVLIAGVRTSNETPAS